MSAGAAFDISLPLFTGPFRLLANLVLDQKIDVCDVPLARVTDEFLHRGAAEMGEWSLEEATWFVATCAVLLELKVGRLLPRPVTETEEDLLGGVSPDLVYARSLELAAFRRVSEVLERRMEAAALMVPRPAGVPEEFAHLYPDPLSGVDGRTLAGLAATLLAPPPSVDLTHITPIRVTLAEGVRSVVDRLTVRSEARFRELVEDCLDRIEVVVRFLAVLELYREGKVEMSQAGPLGDIEVRWRREGGS